VREGPAVPEVPEVPEVLAAAVPARLAGAAASWPAGLAAPAGPAVPAAPEPVSAPAAPEPAAASGAVPPEALSAPGALPPPGALASGGPAGRLTARRARRSSLRPWPSPSWPASADPLVMSLFCRSISSMRAISPVRLPGAVGLARPYRATRELFVRANWCGACNYCAFRIQARCLFLSLVRAPAWGPGRASPGGGAGPGCRASRRGILRRERTLCEPGHQRR